jgi:serine/threonine-protein kinase PpkA
MNISGYVIERQIGKGGMAMVYRAVQTSLGRPVALKVMNPLFSDTPEFSQRFLAEGRLLAAVHHTNIITIHDIGISDGFHFISMEYVEGGDLAGRIRAGLTAPQATDYLVTLANCLAVAHDLHIVHRDIKPVNILFRKDGTLLLTDFGIAKQLTAEQGLTATGVMVGSPHYLSPEQAQGKRVDARADIYSLGVLYYEMLTGSRPFTGDSDVDIAIKHVTEPLPDLPEQFSAHRPIVERMTRKKPDERFPSCRSLLVALKELKETGRWSGEVADIPVAAAPAQPEAAAARKPAAAPAAAPVAAGAGTVVATAGGATVVATVIEKTVPQAPGVETQARTGGSRGGDTLVVDPATPHDGRTAVEATVPSGAPPRVAAAPRAAGSEATLVLEPGAPLPAPARPRRRWFATAGVAAAIVVIAAGAALLFLDRSGTGRSSAPAETAPAAQARGGPPPISAEEQERRQRQALIDSLMRDARAAVAEYRLTTPEATSAYHYYQQVLAIDPNHAGAHAGIAEIADAYHRLARSAVQDWDYDRALRHVTTGLSVSPDHPGLTALRRELEAGDGKTGRTVKKSLKGVKKLFD